MTDTWAANRTDVQDTARCARAVGMVELAQFLDRVLDLCHETGAVLDCDVPAAMDDLDAMLRGVS